MGMHDLRRGHRNLVPCGRASANPAHLAVGRSGLFSDRPKAVLIVALDEGMGGLGGYLLFTQDLSMARMARAKSSAGIT
jgi:hypothetical protein